MDFAVALASAAQALNVVKQLREIDTAMSVAELKAKMADLYGKLADVRMALTDAQEEVRVKDAEIAVLKKRQIEAKPTIEVRGFQHEEVDGKPKGFPIVRIVYLRESKFDRQGFCMLTNVQNANRISPI